MEANALSPAQCRAARGLLDWSQHELAKVAGVGLSTVRDLETGRRQISDEMRVRIRAAVEAAGVALIRNGKGPGVRLTRVDV